MEQYPDAVLTGYPSVEALFHALHEGTIELGVVPAERPTSGIQAAVFQQLAAERNKVTPAVIVEEFYHHAGHALLGVHGTRRDRIRTVLTDDAAWAECGKWAQRNLPKASLEETSTTAWAAREFAGRPDEWKKSAAAIASLVVAKEVGLDVIEEHIDDNEMSHSRYVVVGLAGPNANVDKATIGLIPNRSQGTLAAIFDILKEVDVLSVQMVPMKSVPFLDHRSLVVIDVQVVGDDRIWELVPTLVDKLENSHHAVVAYVFGMYRDGRPLRQEAIRRLADEVRAAAMDPASSDSARQLMALIRNGETESFELKSSLRWNSATMQADTKLQEPIVRTIAGFLNADGGRLLIGVDDDGNLLGIAPDLSTLKKPRTDDFRRALDTAVRAVLGGGAPARTKVTFPEVDDKILCLVEIPPSADGPVWAKTGKESVFLVREGTSTVEYDVPTALRYIAERWPDWRP